MSEVLKTVLSLSLSGTLLFFILRALKPLYKNKLSKRWQYYIWLIVIARMLIPFTPETTLVGSTFIYFENINVEIMQTAPQSNDTQSDMITDGNEVVLGDKPQEQNRAADTTSSLSIQDIFSRVYENLWILWAAIAFALLIRKITMYQSFVRFVKAGRAEVSDIEILNMLADVGETIGVKRPVELFINPLISSPMLLGFFRPYIILPSIEIERTELAYVMRHELTHYKHLDMFYKWLVQLTVCLHWFNPFAYLLAKEINKCCELSCDEAIIRTMDKDEKKTYGDTLLNALKGMGNYNDKFATVTLTEGAEQLKERLEAIMKFKKKSKAIITISLVLTTMLCIGATAIGAYAATPTKETPWSAMGGTGQPYTYSQQGYYQGNYIFELGWNLNTKGYEGYSDKAKLKLADLTTITVSFDKSCKSEMQNQEVLADLKELIERLKTQYSNSSMPLEKPLVVSVKYVGDSDLVKLAEEYYINGELTRFSAIFSSLDVAVQKEYCTKIIENGKTAFLSSCAENMKSDMLDYCAEKTYQEGKITLFSCIAPYLSDDQKQTWIVRASRDDKNTFLSVLTDIGTSANASDNNAAPSNTVTSVSALQDMTADNAKSVSITAKSCGIELMKSESNQFTFDYLGVENPSEFKVTANSNGNSLEIVVDGTAARAAGGHYYIDDGANPVNIVRIGIPDREYQNLTMTLNEAPVTLSDFKAKVNIQAEDGTVSISDKDISKGSYNINNTSGGVSITATTVSSNISIENQGECELFFNQVPQNLGLDLSACRGQIVLPDGWSKTQTFGNSVPSIKINNQGYTEVKVMDSTGKIEIPVTIGSLGSGSEICLGAIPDYS